MNRAELRATVWEVSSGECEWSGCPARAAEMAHIHGIGMGGRPSADVLPNVAALCKFHHDLLDGRTDIARRYEISELLRELVDLKRVKDGWVNE